MVSLLNKSLVMELLSYRTERPRPHTSRRTIDISSSVADGKALFMSLRNSCIVYERKTKDVHGRGPSNINLGLFAWPFDVYRASKPFSLLTMNRCNV